jgi:hypothetical protein
MALNFQAARPGQECARAEVSETSMNHSIYGADRATHQKIVVMALLSAFAVTSLGLSLHLYAKATSAETTVTVKTGKPLTIGSAALTFSR